MQAPHRTYLENLAAARALVKPQFSANMPEEAMIAVIRSNAEELARLHRENDAILGEILYSRSADTLTEEEAAALRELADALFNYNRSPDVGIAYRIHQLLYAYAERLEDPDGMVRELYFQGITLFYLNVRESNGQINLFGDQIGAYFRAGAAWFAQYEQLTSPETRAYIIRCMGNAKYGLPLEKLDGSTEDVRSLWQAYQEVFLQTMAVVQDPRYREMNPEIPWDSFCYTMHYDRTQFLSVLRSQQDPEIAAAVLESAEYVYRHQEQIAAAGEKAVGVRTQYVYAAARYHAGVLPLQEVVKVLWGICAKSDPRDHSGDGIWANLAGPEYLSYYALLLPPDEQAVIRAYLDKAAARRLDYLFHLPVSENAGQVSHLLRTVIEHSSRTDDLFADRVLRYILACHPPTYVHSEVVGCMARWFCARFAEVEPERLEGLFGMHDLASQPGGYAELLEQAYRAGLYHDAGKGMLLSYVGQYSRRLLDEEFSCIKLHPQFGRILLENLGLEDHANVAHCHHCTYDLRGGYPGGRPSCPVRARLMVDIITVVDALDAGTDNVGRSYAAAKTFEALVGELRSGKGTRYAPEVVDLLDDPDFFAATKDFLAQSRWNAYLHAYRGAF